MKFHTQRSTRSSLLIVISVALFAQSVCLGHGTIVYPASRVYRVYLDLSGQGPAFQLGSNAVQIDGSLSYYTWNEVSRNIPQAVSAGLPPGFDYSPWVPDGQLASAGRVDPNSPLYPRTYAGLDQVSPNWPTTPLAGGSVITVQFLATAQHNPSVWDVWMTTPGWNPATPLAWSQMEYLVRPSPTLAGSHYTFNLTVPSNRSGHHVLWVAWQRNDPAGEVFISACDIDITSPFSFAMSTGGLGDLGLQVLGLPAGAVEGYTLFSLNAAAPLGQGPLLGITPDPLTLLGLASPPAPGNPLHFIAPFSPGSYPGGPFYLPPGSTLPLAGMTLDGVVGVVDSSFTLLGATNVSRVAF